MNSARPTNYTLHTFTQNAVQVVVKLVKDESGTFLIAEYIPTEPMLHLYGKDLPLDGIEGVGRPTRLDLVAGIAEPIGETVANVSPVDYEFAGFDRPFPLYPDGPITLSLPIRLPDVKPPSTDLQLAVTYMVCSSDGACKPPVTNKQFTVSIPVEVWNN